MNTKLLPIILATCLFAACTKEKIIPPSPDTPEMVTARVAITNTTEDLLAGKWQITSFLEENVDKTYIFKKYDFSFAANGNLLAISNGQNLFGKWVTTYVDNLIRLSINFSTPAEFIDLSGDWTVINSTDKELKMQRVDRIKDFLTITQK